MSDKSESSLAKSFRQGCRPGPSHQLCVGYADREVNPESIAENTYAESNLSWSVEVSGGHSSPYNSIASTADRHRPILIASFTLQLMIEWRLIAAAHALDKRDRKSVSAFEVGTPRYLNLSQLSTGSQFAKRMCLTEACPWCIALVLL